MLPSEMSMLTSTLTLSHNVPNALRATRYFESDRISVLLSVAGSGLSHTRAFFLAACAKKTLEQVPPRQRCQENAARAS